MIPKGPAGPFFVGAPEVEAKPVLDLVIDTNVALDMLVFGDPRGLAVRDALATGRYRWIGCRAMRLELEDVLARDELRRWTIDRAVVLTAYDGAVREVDPPASIGLLRCSDADDQVFIDLAMQRGAHALLTRDRALLRLAKRAEGFGIVVSEPGTWAADRAGHRRPFDIGNRAHPRTA